ncbi:hypothetical protein J2741_000614 [Methanolinea mesophila]|uniref:PEGA domain-containing protein n=1 Tax=Methanolinea mesophila TaxID=547055 RepID=UPI001AE4D2BD|nr:PEGA domain-containing protein [Methanolinea mesophila]MBP1928067.1 hypothetical protein [Methanolinea mesophila]
MILVWGVLILILAVPACAAVSVTVDPHQIGQSGTVSVHYSGLPDGTNCSLRVQAFMDVDPGSDFLFRAGNVSLPFDLGIVTFTVKNQNTAYNRIVIREWENEPGEEGYDEITFEGPSVDGTYSKSAVSSNAEEGGDIWQVEDSSTALSAARNVVFSGEIAGQKTGGPSEGTFEVPILASNPGTLRFTLVADGEVADSDEIVIGSPVSRSGRIYITSNPSGAGVFIDGVLYGMTPAMIVDVPPGQRIVTLTKDGYVPWKKTVNVQAQRITMLTGIKLTKEGPETGAISVISIPWSAAVYLDDQYKGLTPLTIQGVTAGTHTLKVTKDGYRDYSTTVTVSSGRTTRVPTIRLVRESIPVTGTSGSVFNNIGLLNEYEESTTVTDAGALLQEIGARDSSSRGELIQNALSRFRAQQTT